MGSKVEVDTTGKQDGKFSMTKSYKKVVKAAGINGAVPKAITKVNTTGSTQEKHTNSWSMLIPRFDVTAQHVGIENLYNGTGHAINAILYTVKAKTVTAHEALLKFQGDAKSKVAAAMAMAKGTLAAKGMERHEVEVVAQNGETTMFA